ncbi:MAG TPA: PAS domain S-box protein [Bacteroidales bacterium]|nr:PAS domain S-box protein [Bacteroidales bacterium]
MDKAKMSQEELEKRIEELENSLSQSAFFKNLYAESDEIHFRVLIENVPEPIIIQIDGKFAYLNNASLALYGATSANEIIGKDILSRIHPDYIDIVGQRIKNLNEERLPAHNLEYKHLKLDGTAIDVEVSAVPITYKQKEGALVFIKDITERKKTEARITGLSNIIENSLNEIYVFDTETLIFRFLNKSALNNLGYSLAEMQHLTPLDIKPLYIRQQFISEVKPLLDGTQALHKFETIHKRKNGTTYPVEVNLQITHYEGKKCFVAVITDITERKKNEDEIKQRTEELKNFFDCAIDLLCIANTDGYFLKLNKQWENVLGYTLADLENKKFLDFVHPDDIPSTLETIQTLSQQCNILNYVNRYRCKNGDYRWIEWRSTPQGNIVYASARDITEQKQIQDALVQKNMELEASEEEIRATNEELISTTNALKENFAELQKAKEILEESELNLIEAQRISKIGNWHIDIATNKVKWSKSCFLLFDIDESHVDPEHLHAEFRKCIIPEDIERVNKIQAEAMLKQEGTSYEFRAKVRNFTRSFHVIVEPLFDAGKKLIAFKGIIQDITERKQAEEKLKEQQALFETVFNTITDAVIITDKERKITLSNKGVESIFGYSSDEIIGKSTETLYAGKEFFLKAGKEVFNEYSLNSGNFYLTKYVSKDGVEFPGETFGAKLYNTNGEWIGNLAVMRNVSERLKYIEELKIARETAEKSEELKTELLDKLKEAQQIGKVGSWDWNLQTGEVWWSDELYKIFELNPKTFTPSVENNAKFVHPEDTEGYHSAAARCIKTGEFLEYELRIITPLGKIKNCKSTAKVFFDKKHNATRMSGTFTDISEQIRNKEELIKAKEKAEESDRLKTAFLNNISHEIRTPMNAIVGFSGFLNDPDLRPEKREHFTDMIIQSSNQLLSIITDIISIATIEAGQEKILEMEIRLNATLKFLYAHYAETAAKKNIRLHFETGFTDDDDKIITDKTKLEGILTNLIANALKFTHSGHVNFGYRVRNSFIEFFVEDTGIGIPADMHNEIFKRFRQVEVTANRKFGGSGLGLSISKAYAELLGGKIWLTSELGKGSTFFFTIPYRKPAPIAEPTLPYDTERTKGKPVTLLIAEDEDSNFLLLTEMLSKKNIQIIRAVNGIETVNIAKTNPNLDMILMDIKMPEMDGLEATRQIKAFRPSIPIAALTAYSFPEEKNQAFMAGCDMFLPKPIRKEELLQSIRQVIKGI